jgi:hypothetical protein
MSCSGRRVCRPGAGALYQPVAAMLAWRHACLGAGSRVCGRRSWSAHANRRHPGEHKAPHRFAFWPISSPCNVLFVFPSFLPSFLPSFFFLSVVLAHPYGPHNPVRWPSRSISSSTKRRSSQRLAVTAPAVRARASAPPP